MPEPCYFIRYEGETEIMFISALADLLVQAIEETRRDPGMGWLHEYARRLRSEAGFRKAEYERFKAGSQEIRPV